MKRLVKIVAAKVETVWWTDASDFDTIVRDGRLVAMKRDDAWYCEAGGKWNPAGFCAFALDELPCWPDISEPREQPVDAATEPLYIKYIPYRHRRGRWTDDDDYSDWGEAA